MCRSVECPTCHGKSWTGCGQHIPSAMNSYPQSEWCTCVGADGKRGEFPPKAGDANSPLITVIMAALVGYLLLKLFRKI